MPDADDNTFRRCLISVCRIATSWSRSGPLRVGGGPRFTAEKQTFVQ
jgi:hypothetical protein